MLQFSTAPPGKAAFVPDPSEPARQMLHRVYYAQLQFREKHGKWATSLADLGLKDLTHPAVTGPPKLETTTSLFEASVELKEPGTGLRHWHIGQDAKVWGD